MYLFCVNHILRIEDEYMKIMQECFQHLNHFCQVMDQCTENYECLVINNNVKSNKLQDQIFWYKADVHKDFKLGSREFWEISKDLHSDDEEELYDPNIRSGKRQGPKINVKKNRW